MIDRIKVWFGFKRPAKAISVNGPALRLLHDPKTCRYCKVPTLTGAPHRTTTQSREVGFVASPSGRLDPASLMLGMALTHQKTLAPREESFEAGGGQFGGGGASESFDSPTGSSDSSCGSDD